MDADPIDPYGSATAEFYDLLATAHWEEFGPQLDDLLAGVDAAAGPVLDVGSGTGVGLPYVRRAVPGVRIHAIEPSKAMRTALHSRLALDPELRDVTTVDPRPLADARLPDRASAVLASAALGHLGDDERRLLWRYAASAVVPGGPTVVEVLPPHRAEAFELTRYRALRVGDFVYEGWQEGHPLDDRTMQWRMMYRVLDGDEVVAEYAVAATWRCFSVADVQAEVAEFGLILEERGDAVVLRTPAR